MKEPGTFTIAVKADITEDELRELEIYLNEAFRREIEKRLDRLVLEGSKQEEPKCD